MLLEVHNITKRLGGTAVLDNVSFSAGAGEAVALIGPNGAGKTTLLKCLLGLLRFEGTALVDGLDVSSFGKQARAITGYLPQSPRFPPLLTAGEALAYHASLRGLRDEDIDARLDSLGLIPHAAKPVAALSGGLRQRLGLAVAPLGDPPLLLLDEPVASLDPEGREIFAGLISDLTAQGRTVLLSTHVYELLELVVGRAIALVDGRVAYDGPVDGLIQREDAPSRLIATLPLEEARLAHAALLRADVPPAAIRIQTGTIGEALDALRREVVA